MRSLWERIDDCLFRLQDSWIRLDVLLLKKSPEIGECPVNCLRLLEAKEADDILSSILLLLFPKILLSETASSCLGRSETRRYNPPDLEDPQARMRQEPFRVSRSLGKGSRTDVESSKRSFHQVSLVDREF